MTSLPVIRQVEVDGLRLAYSRAGTGPPLVLLHSGLSDSRDWTAQLASLCDSFDLVAWDAPGCGGSDDPPPGWTASDYGDALAGFVTALGLGRPHVLGLSWGAVLALELWRGHPDVPASLRHLPRPAVHGRSGSRDGAGRRDPIARLRSAVRV